MFPVLSSFGLTITIGLYQTIEVLEPQLHLPPPVGIGSPLICARPVPAPGASL